MDFARRMDVLKAIGSKLAVERRVATIYLVMLFNSGRRTLANANESKPPQSQFRSRQELDETFSTQGLMTH